MEDYGKIGKCIKKDEKGIIITDENNYEIRRIDDIGDEYVEENADRIVMIHCTDFFPKGHKILTAFDGNKEININQDLTYDGITKECEALQHRHTVHFTLNARVRNTGAGEGEWDKTKYMIVEPLKKHVDQFVCKSPSDAYTLGSVQLSDAAVIMVREDAIDEIPEEELDKYTIVRFRGDPVKCLENFLQLNEYEVFHTDANAAHHAHSPYNKLERALNSRDMFINYIRNNTYLSREPIELSSEEVFTMCNIAKQNQRMVARINTVFDELAKQKGISPEIFQFYITSGLIPTEDGKFTFKSDREILDVLEELDQLSYKLGEPEDYEKILNSRGIKIEEIKELYDAYCESEFEKLSAELDMYSFFEENKDEKESFKVFEERYIEAMRGKRHLNTEELKKFYEKQLELYYKKEFEDRKKRTLSKRMSDFKVVYDQNKDENVPVNASEKEMDMHDQLRKECIDRIRKKTKEKGIDKYIFSERQTGLNLITLTDEATEEIDKDLQGKEHYCGIDKIGNILLDFKEKEDETLGEYLERLEKYTDCFLKYYNGETVDESIKFDENGELIEEAKLDKTDFKKVAISKEAAVELQTGATAKEIKAEIAKDKNTNDKAVEGGEHDE